MPDIGTRLEAFLKSKFGDKHGWLKRAGDSIGLDGSGLQRYLRGQTVPGTAMQAKLRAIGCDIEWLMTGEKSASDKLAELEKKHSEDIARLERLIREGTPERKRDTAERSGEAIDEDNLGMLRLLHDRGITTVRQLERWLHQPEDEALPGSTFFKLRDANKKELKKK